MSENEHVAAEQDNASPASDSSGVRSAPTEEATGHLKLEGWTPFKGYDECEEMWLLMNGTKVGWLCRIRSRRT